MKQYRSEKAGEKIINTYNKLVKQWGIEVEEMDLTSQFGITHIIAAGDKTLPPLILFHGVGDDSSLMWIFNAKSLSEHFRIYAVDTIGGPGKSRMGKGYFEDYDDAAWFEDILKQLKLKKVSIAGVSNGGYLCQIITARRPERVEKAISISCTVAYTGKEKHSMKVMMKIFMPEALFPTRKNTIKLLKKLSGDNYRVFTDNPLIFEHYQALLKGFNNMAMSYHHVTPLTLEEMNRIRDKVYYLVGDADPFEILGGREAILTQKVNAHFYPNAGHGLNHECADEINQMMIDILKGKVHNIRNYK